MKYPKGEIIHRNLSTEYTDVPELISTLMSNGFAGIVEIEGTDKKGAFLVASGSILNAFVESKANPAPTVGEEAVKELFSLASRPNQSLNVYKMSAKEVELVAGTLSPEVLFKELSTDFVRLDRFIMKLTSDKLSGYIEILTKHHEPQGTLFLKEGQLVGLYVTDETGSSHFVGDKTIPAFIEDVAKKGAIVHVYRSVYLPLPAKADTKIKAGAQATNIKQPTVETKDDLPEEVLIHVDNRTPDHPENGRGEFVTALEGVLSEVEKVVDRISEQGGFQRAFKRALLEKSEVYPYLDPFGNQFDYYEGKVLLDRDVRTEDFAVGVADCLCLALSYLKQEFPKKMALPPRLQRAIDSSFQPYVGALKSSGLDLSFP